MLITYQPNPLCTVIELDGYDLEKLRLNLVIENLQERIYGADYRLEAGERFDVEAARRELSADTAQEDSRSRADVMLKCCVEALGQPHCGDCTCVPCACTKCYVEDLLGINTIAGLDKHAAAKIHTAFAKNGSLERTIAALSDYRPIQSGDWKRFPAEDFERHVLRWTEEAHRAAAWLRQYQVDHFAT